MKKLLFLGGASSQLPAIQLAKDLGYFVITCDYLPQNPGHKISDKYYNISTIDSESVFKIAEMENIDGITSYASDPGAFTAALISERLGLIGSTSNAVDILTNKFKFRQFQKENNFKYPEFIKGSELEDFKEINNYPGVLKPIDSSGSKGVKIINSKNDLIKHFEYSKSFSREGIVIYEQFIDRKGPQIHGEVFVLNNEIIFFELGDQYFSPINNVVPYSTIIPSIYHQWVLPTIMKELQRAIKLLNFTTGGMNVEVLLSKSSEIYFLEIGARSGGNFMPDLIGSGTGVDLVNINIKAILEKEPIKKINYECSQTMQVIFHSFQDGMFDKLQLPVELLGREIKIMMYVETGDKVNKYVSSRDVVGVGIFNVADLERKKLEMILLNHQFISLL